MRSSVARLAVVALVASSLPGCDRGAGADTGSAPSGSGPKDASSPASSAAPSAAASAAPPAGAPSADAITGELVQKLAGFPEPLAARAFTTPRGVMDGTVVFERDLVASHGFVAFRVFVCEGPCTHSIVTRLRGTPALQESNFDVRDGRVGTATLFSMMLGGAGFVTSAPAPGRYSLVVLFELPPGDIEVDPATRKYLGEHDPKDVTIAVHRGVDALLFP